MADSVDNLAALRRVAEAAQATQVDAPWPETVLRILARLAAAERVCEALKLWRDPVTMQNLPDWAAVLREHDAWRATQQETPDAPR